MPTLRFVGKDGALVLEAEAEAGGALVDFCDELEAPIPFSCRSASCGTCRIDVLEGIDCFEPASDEEAEILELFADPPTRRLACSARLRPGPGLVVIRAAED